MLARSKAGTISPPRFSSPSTQSADPGTALSSPRSRTSWTFATGSAYCSPPTRTRTCTLLTGHRPLADRCGRVAGCGPQTAAVEPSLQAAHELLDALGGACPQLLLGGQLLGRAADLHHRRGRLGGGVLLVVGRRHALLGGEDRGVALLLDAVGVLTDRLRRVHRALGKLAYLAGDDGKPAAGIAGPRRLDRSVEREQIGLLGDSIDQLYHLH